jgi:hypothetical protein
MLYLAKVPFLPDFSKLFEPKDYLHRKMNIPVGLLEVIFGNALKIDADFWICI